MRMVTVEGKPYASIKAACRAYGVITNAVYMRERKGLTFEQAILEEAEYCERHNNDTVIHAIERDKAEDAGFTVAYIRRLAKKFELSFDEAISLAVELKTHRGSAESREHEYLFCMQYKIPETIYYRVLGRFDTRDLAEKYIIDTLKDKHIVVFEGSAYNNFAALCETYPVIQYRKLLHRKLISGDSFESLVHAIYWVLDGVPYRLLKDVYKVLGIPDKVAITFSRKHEYSSHDEAVRLLKEMVN